MVLRMPSLLVWARVQLFLMNNIPLIIMAAGVSSRMKTSNVSTDLSEDQVYQSNSRAKGFIEINEKYSRIWPNITEAKDPMPDREEWKEKTNKIDVLILE